MRKSCVDTYALRRDKQKGLTVNTVNLMIRQLAINNPTLSFPRFGVGNAASDAPASRNAGALPDEFPLRSAHRYTQVFK